MKRVALVVSFLFLFTAVGFASPLTDFSQGKAAIDINLRPGTDLDFSGLKLDGKSGNVDLGLTIGLGNKFAFQWQNQNLKSKDYYVSGTSGGNTITMRGNSKTSANQFNILYSLDKNLAGFVGYTQAKNEIEGTASINGGAARFRSGKSVNGWQAGFVGSFKMSDNFTGYGTIGFGSKLETFEFGVAYVFSKNAELNLFYKSTKYKDLQFEGLDWKYDLKADGPGIGVTFKF